MHTFIGIALGAVLSGAASVLTLFLSQRHALLMARDERAGRAAEASEQRLFQLRENRYTDRRDAVVGLIAAAEDEAERVQEFQFNDRYGGLAPGEIHDDYMFTALNAAYARLAVLAEPEVGLAGRELRDSVYECFSGGSNAWARYGEALDAFQVSSQRMLGTT